MRKNIKIISLTLLFVVLFVTVVSASGNGLSVDGTIKDVNLDNVQGRTLIEGQFLEGMGFNVSLYGSTATIKNSEVIFKFAIDTNNAEVNGIALELDAKSYVKNGEVYVPLRFVFETLGYEVKWDGVNSRVLAEKGNKITYPISFEDTGKTYTVNSEPDTIVSLAPSATEILFSLGVGDKIVGRSEYDNYPSEATKIEVMGSMTEPSVEKVISAFPDLMISTFIYKEEILNKFEEAGIETVSETSPETIEDMYDFIIKLGAIVDRNYEARAMVSSMKSKVGTLQMRLKSVKNKPEAYFVVGTGQWGEYTAGRDTFISEIISLAGGKNVADDVTGWNYSIEKLIDNDPEIIFGGEFNITTMKNGSNYQILSAVQNNKCIIVNEDIFSRPSPRLINEGLEILLEMLHKDIAKELNY